jgi:hypothetical protein
MYNSFCNEYFSVFNKDTTLSKMIFNTDNLNMLIAPLKGPDRSFEKFLEYQVDTGDYLPTYKLKDIFRCSFTFANFQSMHQF